MLSFEERYPVATWRVGDTFVWPLIRYLLHTQNVHVLQAAGAPATTLDSKLRRLAAMADGARRGAVAALTDWRRTAGLRRTDAVLYSDGVSMIRVGGAWYDRFCDPFAASLDEAGVSHQTWRPLHTYAVPRTRDSMFIQPALDAVTLLANATRARLASRDTSLDGYDEASRFVAGLGLPKGLPTVDEIVRSVHYIRCYAAFFRTLFTITRPRAFFVVCFYGGETMAACLAARQLGIATVDIQHGAAGGSAYYPYVGWKTLPRDGYALLPDVFWCWTESDLEAVRRWSDASGGRHRAVVAGNQLLASWRDGVAPGMEDYDARVRRARGSRTGIDLLVTLNGFEDDAKLDRLAALCRDHRELVFWLRAHPSRPERRERVRAALARVGADAIVDEATDLPLYSLLRHVRVHATEISSTVIEAEAFGVPTVLFHPGEAKPYADIVARGWAVVRDGVDLIPDGVAELLARDQQRGADTKRRAALEREGIAWMVELARRGRAFLST